MSKSKNIVEWCLKKAKDETEKGEMHRGLIKIKSGKESAFNYIKKA